jgi:hypothetical protein
MARVLIVELGGNLPHNWQTCPGNLREIVVFDMVPDVEVEVICYSNVIVRLKPIHELVMLSN